MGLLRRKKKATEAAADALDTVADRASPSPNPMTNLLLADIAMRAGGAILKRGVETGLLGAKVGTKTAGKVVKSRGIGKSLVRTALARVATRSVPGAIVVGGGLLAKTLYDRHKGKAAAAEGHAEIRKAAKKAE